MSENYAKSNNHYKKINTAEYQEKLKLYSNKEKDKEKSSKKFPNSFPLLKETRRKTILNKIFDIPTEVSPFNIIENSTNEKKKYFK
jgi:hypothetical protein